VDIEHALDHLFGHPHRPSKECRAIRKCIYNSYIFGSGEHLAMSKRKEAIKPVYKAGVPIAKDRFLNIAAWRNNLVLEIRAKEGDEWKSEAKISLPMASIPEFYTRLLLAVLAVELETAE